VLRELIRQGGLLSTGAIQTGRTSSVTFIDSGLARKLTIYPKPPGELRWQVDVGDEQLQQPNTTAFWTTYSMDNTTADQEQRRANPDRARYPWPVAGTVLAANLVNDVRDLATPMLWFLHERHDLGLLLLGGDESPGSSTTVRGGIAARRWSGGAAALVHAVILARTTADHDLEEQAFAKLERLGNHRSEGLTETFHQAVSRRAREAQTSSPVDLSDLTATRPRLKPTPVAPPGRRRGYGIRHTDRMGE
jgi:hypothetical protein